MLIQFQHQFYRQIRMNTHFNDDEDIEDIPSEFDALHPVPREHHETPQFYSNLGQRNSQALTPKRISQHFLVKTEQYQHEKKQRIDYLKAEVEQRAMADCTFKPSINRNSKSKNSRNLKQFLQSQTNHLNKIQEKNSALKLKIEDENRNLMTFSPKINRKKYNNNKENVHERLYKLKDKERDKDHDQTYNYTPKITERGQKIVRNIPIEQLLYLDAKRRAEKHSYQMVDQGRETKSKNNNIEKYAAQKFLKDFKSGLIALNLLDKVQYSQNQFLEILKKLGFTKFSHCDHNNSIINQERKLLKDAYEYLEPFGLSQSNIYVFLLAVSGIYGVEVSDGTIVLEQEGKKIHNYFDCLFRNRLFNDCSKKSKTPPKQQNSFKPSINPDSQNLAEKYRCKMMERASEIFAKNDINIEIPEKGLTHGDFLVICNLGQNLQKDKMRQNKLRQNDPQCTFQPNTQKHSHQSMGTGMDKCQQLYLDAKFKQQQIKRLNVQSSQSQLQQNTAKLQTLSPRCNGNKYTHLPKSNIKSYLEIKDVDKTLARMVVGRQQRNQKKEFEERGEKLKNKDFRKVTPQKIINRAVKREVLLDVDVSINNINKKIFIYRQDRHRVQQVVAEFSRANGLDIISRKNLESQLVAAVQNISEADE